MKRLSGFFKSSSSFQTRLYKYRNPLITQTYHQYTPIFRHSLYFSPQSHFSKVGKSNVKSEIKHGKEDSSYTPLPGGRQIFQSLDASMFSDKGIDYYCKFIDLYSSSSNINSFTKEEAREVFYVLYLIGLNFLETETQDLEASKWLEHCVKFAKRAEDILSPHEQELLDALSTVMIPGLKASQGVENAEEIENINPGEQKGIDWEITGTVESLINEGLVSYNANNKEKALEQFTEAIKIIEEEPKLSYQLLGDQLRALYGKFIQILIDKGEKIEADNKARKGIEFLEKIYGVDCVQTVGIIQNMIVSLQKQERFDDVLVYVKKLKDIMLKNFDKESVEYMSTIQSLGIIYYQIKKYREALECFEDLEKFLAENPSKKDSFPKNHYYCMILTQCYGNEGRYEEAQKSFDQAKEFACKSFGEISEEVADCYFQAAQVWSRTGDYPRQGKALYEKAIDLYEKVGDKCTLKTGKTLHNYGGFLSVLAEIERAIDAQKKALEYLEKINPAPTEWLEKVYGFLGLNYANIGKYEESFHSLKKAIEFCNELGNSSGRMNAYQDALNKIEEEAGTLESMKWKGKDFWKNK